MTNADREQELKIRLGLADVAIRVLEQETNDPRQAEALAWYRLQRAQIHAQLDQINLPKEADKPADIVIGLKTAVLFARSDELGG